GSCAGAPNDLERLILCIKNLDATIAEFADVLSAGVIHTNIVRIAHLAFAGTVSAEGTDEFAFVRKNLDAMVARIGNMHIVLGIDAETLGTVEIARTGARMAEAVQKNRRWSLFTKVG